ncbi:MAG: DNA mismatch repair endonuclease MutL [Syntrophomonas sp.]
MTIRLLEENLINQIAAGEVIERPASIVKELLENSIDAGSGRINVGIVQAGLDCIQVEDDGEGISYDELPLAFLRHATSKIMSESDLSAILTMGFRGEALPSIASVARVDIYSSRDNDDPVHARIEGGQLQEMEHYPASHGTKIIVKDLFYNTPARKKFLKSPVTEAGNVYETVCKYALARPDISFAYHNEKKQYFKTPGNGQLRDAIIAVFGKDYNQNLLDISFRGFSYSLTGLISTPAVSRLNRKNQFFFVNNRPVRSPMLYKAVDTAYRGLLVSREHPVVILHLTIPPDQLDVNVHPQKSEVRFRDEKAVFKMINEVLRSALDNQDVPPVSSWIPQTAAGRRENYTYQPVKKLGPEWVVVESLPGEFASSGQSIIPSPPTRMGGVQSPRTELPPWQDNNSRQFKVIAQTLNSYIIMEEDESLWIVDQHAAHERIMYSRLKKIYSGTNQIAQTLAFPLSLELSGQQMEVVETNLDFFQELGFILEIMSYNSIVLRAIPVFLVGQEKESIIEIIDLLSERKNVDLREAAIIKMACRQAVKAGNRLNHQEMETIMEELLRVENYMNCPHGRPTMIKFGRRDLDRMFKR